MACNCGSKRGIPNTRGAMPASRGVAPVAPGNLVTIVYAGPVGTHMVPSPLRRVSTYGLHTRGDIFQVDEGDQQTKPEIFVLKTG